MRLGIIAIGLILGTQGAMAHVKLSCSADGQELILDSRNKQLTLTKDGARHELKILGPATHGFEMFGKTSAAFDVDDGYMIGIKDTKERKLKNLSVFKNGEQKASFIDCKEI
jgi:hypothetical protein